MTLQLFYCIGVLHLEKEIEDYIKKLSGLPKDPVKKFDCKLLDPDYEAKLKKYIEKTKAILRP